MCLGEIGRVSAVDGTEALSVVIGDRVRTASAILLDAPPRVGDWVVVHAGFVLAPLTEAEAQAALRLREGAR